MQVQICEHSCDMKRDMDLVRDLLFHMEGNSNFNGTKWTMADRVDNFGVTDHSLEEVNYHLNLLIEDGLVKWKPSIEGPVINKITWKGHEFLDDIRDQDIWHKTKERAKGLSSIGIALTWEIAKAELKKKLGLP